MGGGILYLIGFAAIFMIIIYLLMVRPMSQREKQHDEMVEELQKGDTVITAGGMYGTIDSIREDSVIIKVESGALIRITKGGVIKRNE